MTHRTSNINDFEKYRRTYNNPLFDLFTDDFDDFFKEKNISKKYVIKNFYVDARKDQIICQKSLMEKFLNAPKKIIKRVSDIDNGFCDSPGMVYLLLGKKGMGKTTILLKYYYDVLKKQPIQEERIDIYIDLRSRKTDYQFKNGLPKTLVEHIFYLLKNEEHPVSRYLTDPEMIRKLDPSYKCISDSDLQMRILDNKEEAINFLFGWAYRNKYPINIIIDNIDDYSLLSVKALIDKASDFKNQYQASCVVALRDYWSPIKLRIDDTNLCVFHLSKPDIVSIFKKRLDAFEISKINSAIKFMYGGYEISLNNQEVIEIFKEIVDDLESKSNRNIHEDIYKLTNYNTREYLSNMYNFFHSPYLFSRANFIKIIINKIHEIDPEANLYNPRKLKFFDFLENFMAIHSLCFDKISSNIFNLFFHDYEYTNGYNYRNTLIFIRILQSLPFENNSTRHKLELLEIMYMIGYKNESVIHAVNILLENSLLSSSDGINFDDAESLSLSAKGRIYLKKVMTEWSYLVSICDVVPMPKTYKVSILDKFGDDAIPLTKGSLVEKNKSVRKFISFLHEEELEEQKHINQRGRRVYSSITDNVMLYYLIQLEVNKIISRLTSFKAKKNHPIIDFQIVT